MTTQNRPWLNDPRAYFVLKHWLRYPGCYKVQGYNTIENFRAWVARATNHFFDVKLIWKDEYVVACCTRLGVEPPDPPLYSSWSEDEYLASRCQADSRPTPLQERIAGLRAKR